MTNSQQVVVLGLSEPMATGHEEFLMVLFVQSSVSPPNTQSSLPSPSFPFLLLLTAVDAGQRDMQLQALCEGEGGSSAGENETLNHNGTITAAWQ